MHATSIIHCGNAKANLASRFMKKTASIWNVVLLVFVTFSISFAPSLTQGQRQNSKQQDLTKYPTVDFDAPEPSDPAERARKEVRDRRYEKNAFIVRTPMPDYSGSTLYDNEPMPPAAFPFNQSKLVIIGTVTGSKAVMTTNKAAVYSEFTIRIENVLKQSRDRTLQAGQVVSADRLGGRVRYLNGAVMLYLNDWHDLPEPCGNYLFFLDGKDIENPNYKIVTAYLLKNEKVSPLDSGAKFREYSGRKKDDFIQLVKEAAKN